MKLVWNSVCLPLRTGNWRAKEWLNCEEYREPRKMRHRTTKTNMILVEGV
jgi:uncharacterized protein (DUF1330 family)